MTPANKNINITEAILLLLSKMWYEKWLEEINTVHIKNPRFVLINHQTNGERIEKLRKSASSGHDLCGSPQECLNYMQIRSSYGWWSVVYNILSVLMLAVSLMHTKLTILDIPHTQSVFKYASLFFYNFTGLLVYVTGVQVYNFRQYNISPASRYVAKAWKSMLKTYQEKDVFGEIQRSIKRHHYKERDFIAAVYSPETGSTNTWERSLVEQVLFTSKIH